MITLFVLAYILSNLGSAILLGCMLQTAFVDSSTIFRVFLGFLGMMCVCCVFVGLWSLTEMDALEEVSVLVFVQVIQSIAFMLVLLLMRLRQRAAGLDRHPKEMRGAALGRFC